MKLVRYGAKGREKPGLIDAQGKLRDLSSHCTDIGWNEISPAGQKRLKAINPLTLVEHTYPLLPSIDLLLCMTVNPGFGGQTFLIDVLEKVRSARKYIIDHNLNVDIEVDGGVNLITAGPSVTAGANVLVAGTALFKQPDMAAAIKEFRFRATEAGSAG